MRGGTFKNDFGTGLRTPAGRQGIANGTLFLEVDHEDHDGGGSNTGDP